MAPEAMEFGTDRVLVTGAAGWLGKGLLNALGNGLPETTTLARPQAGLKVRAFALPGQEDEVTSACADAEVVSGDLRSAEDCERFCSGASGAVLLHAAGIIHPRRVREFYEINVEGTRNVLSAAADAGVRRAVIMSSNSPIGCNPHPDHLFDEQSPYHPYMNYGRSKMRMELHVREVRQQGRIETVVIRAPWFYGPFQPPRQTLFFRMIRDGKAPIVGGGDNRRSMAYIDNLAQGMLLAAVVPAAAGQTYWIADERPYAMNEIVDTVEGLLETEFGQTCRHKRMRLPGVASGVAWLLDWTIQGLGFYHQKFHVLSEMNKTIACSIAKAQAELGYSPTVGLEEGMRRSLRWIFDRQGGLDD